MINEAGKITDPEKAGWWIGWILAHMELHGFWDNERSRELIRKDVRT